MYHVDHGSLLSQLSTFARSEKLGLACNDLVKGPSVIASPCWEALV